MKKMIELESNLTSSEVKDFEKVCAELGVCPAQKLGDLVHGFIVAQGVKHRMKKAVSGAA